jgi:hypothetical protein
MDQSEIRNFFVFVIHVVFVELKAGLDLGLFVFFLAPGSGHRPRGERNIFVILITIVAMILLFRAIRKFRMDQSNVSLNAQCSIKLIDYLIFSCVSFSVLSIIYHVLVLEHSEVRGRYLVQVQVASSGQRTTVSGHYTVRIVRYSYSYSTPDANASSGFADRDVMRHEASRSKLRRG